MNAYRIILKNGMTLRHDAKVRFTLSAGGEVLEDRLVPVSDIGGAVTVARVVYNGLTMSGGTAWRHPTTGIGIDRPSYRLRVRQSDLTNPDKLCTCERCSPQD